jgi:integrase
MALAFIGLRPAEIIGLQWQDISRDEIRIERSMWRGTIAPCKNKRSRRIVALGPGVASLLARYQAVTVSVSGFVLENSIGKPVSTSGLAKLAREIIRPALKAHGYDWKSMYAGRHGAVTEMNRHTNGNVQVAAAHFGHSPEVEAKHYLHGIPEETRKASEALDSAITGDLRDKQETVAPALSVSDR